MSTPATPSNPTPAGDDRNLVAVDSSAAPLDEKLHSFWQRNRNVIFGLCVVVLLVIIGREGWQYLSRKKELDVEKAYAAATTPEQLKAFAVAHPDHELGGIAQLRMADDAYKAGKAADAVAGYEKAIAALKQGPLAARAKLGHALAKLQAGQAADGQGELKKIADNTGELKAVRAEALYHLTSLAVDGNNAADAQKYVDQLMQLDPANPWTQRAMMTRATLPAQTVAAPAAKDSAPKDGAGKGKQDAGGSSVKLNIPGK